MGGKGSGNVPGNGPGNGQSKGRRGGTGWELLPAVLLIVVLAALVLLADLPGAAEAVLLVGLALAVGVLLGKVDVGRR